MATEFRHEPSDRFGAALAGVEAELDWSALGAGYCSGDAREFFDADRIEKLREHGFEIAAALGTRLVRGGRSIYIGAAVAELVPILFEALVFERSVTWHNLATDETDELARATAAVGERLGLELPAPSTADPAAMDRCDHVWCVSLLTDPDHFPALHDALYERSSTSAVGGGDRVEEEARARRLLSGLLRRLSPGGLLTTTEEEWPLARDCARSLGAELSDPEPGPLTGLVGDRLVWSRRCEPQKKREP